MSSFWKIWIQLWCLGTLALGLALAAGAFPATDLPARLYYDLITWPMDGSPVFESSLMRFTCGVLGAVLVGWAVTILYALAAAQGPAPQLWMGMTVAMGVWFVIDSAISVLTGFPGNAVANTVFLVLWLIPMFATGSLGRREG
jgi:hypothetical protein